MDNGISAMTSVTESSGEKSTKRPSSASSCTRSIYNVQEPELKRKASAEKVDGLKKAKLENVPSLDSHTRGSTSIIPPGNSTRPTSPLRQEHHAAVKTSDDYGASIVEPGKDARYKCIITKNALDFFRQGMWYAASSFVMYRAVMDVSNNLFYCDTRGNPQRAKAHKGYQRHCMGVSCGRKSLGNCPSLHQSLATDLLRLDAWSKDARR